MATKHDTPATPVTEPEAPAATKPVLDLTLLNGEQEAEFTAADKHVPAEVKAFVDRAHNFWKESPKKWRKIDLGNEAAVKETVKLARLFAQTTDRMFRVKTHDGQASLLVYKVTDKPGSGETPAE